MLDIFELGNDDNNSNNEILFKLKFFKKLVISLVTSSIDNSEISLLIISFAFLFNFLNIFHIDLLYVSISYVKYVQKHLHDMKIDNITEYLSMITYFLN